MFNLAECYVEVGAITRGVDAALATVKGKLMAFGSMRVGLGGAGGIMGMIGGGMALAGLHHVIGAASDLNETMNMVRVTFGDAADAIIASANTMAERFGISRKEWIEGTSAIGSMGKAMGMSADMGSKFGLSVMSLASDFASLRNLKIEDALQKFQAGLSGEMEPLKRYGIMLSEVNVKQEAVRIGLVKGGQELTEQQKLQARYSLILKSTTDAEGDRARTAGEFANQSKQLSGSLQNLSETIGTALLPAANVITSALNELIAGFGTATEKSDRLTSSGASLAAWFEEGSVVVRNFGDICERTGTVIGGYIGEGAMWAKDVVVMAFEIISKSAANLATNLISPIKEVMDYLASGFKDPIEIKLKPILDGPALKDVLKVLKGPDLTSVGAALAKIDERMVAREAARRAAKSKDDLEKPMAAKDMKFEGDTVGKGFKAAITSGDEYSKMIQKAALDTKSTELPRAALAEAKKTTELLKDIKDGLKGRPVPATLA